MIGQLIEYMIYYYGTDIKRINHFLKVYGFARTIAEKEIECTKKRTITELAAIVHDIGIKISEEKYQSSAGHYQELEGPSIAREMLLSLHIPEDMINRICYLVGHHHTYTNIDDIDYQILIEADFLVNIHEDQMNSSSIHSIKEKIFKTVTGIKLLETLYQ